MQLTEIDEYRLFTDNLFFVLYQKSEKCVIRLQYFPVSY